MSIPALLSGTKKIEMGQDGPNRDFGIAGSFVGTDDGRAMARDVFGPRHGHDRKRDTLSVEPGEALVSMAELQELLGADCARPIRDALGAMGAPIRRTRRGCVVPIEWVRANRDRVFGLAAGAI